MSNSTTWPRGAGILLPFTSLPGPLPWGTFSDALLWVDWLARAGVRYWQLLPIEPAGPGHSPYSSPSALATDMRGVDPLECVRLGWLGADEVRPPASDPSQAGFDLGRQWHHELVMAASTRFLSRSNDPLRSDFEAWRATNADWAEDEALFSALKTRFGGKAWSEWDPPLARRHPRALDQARRDLHTQCMGTLFGRWMADRQWTALRRAAQAHGILLIGDIPIFVALDSVDVWAQPHLFRVDQEGRPEVVAGVPPDYFSATGQRWGNPHYRWESHAADGYRWWGRRLRRSLERVDRLRIDHFRGFCAAWAIPPEHPTAVDGRWEPAPGEAFFEAMQRKIPRGSDGRLPLVAEDLGVITPDVESLRDTFRLPGMKVLQFAFDSDWDNPFLPHRCRPDSIVYTGTHDNDTTAGWWAAQPDTTQRRMLEYAGGMTHDPSTTLCRLAWTAPSRVSVVPLQDLLGLGSQARMNHPGRPEGNWQWRAPASALDPSPADSLSHTLRMYGRHVASPPVA